MPHHASRAAVVFLVLAIAGVARADNPPIQPGEATEVAHRLLAAVARKDAAAAAELVDTDALVARISEGVDASDAFEAGFRRTFPRQVQTILGAIMKGADGYHFLRVRQVDGQTRMLFRLIVKGGLNYHDWILQRDAQGNVRIVDSYIAVNGELLSQTLHRAYVQAAVASNPGLIDRLTGKDKEMADNLQGMLQMAHDSQAGSFRKVLEDYKNLSPEMQQDKGCMVLRLTAAERLQKQAPQPYADAMADYKRMFPQDPSIDLDCLDALIQQKKFVEARQSCDRIDAFTGGDPYLDVLRGTTFYIEGGDANLEQAKVLYQKAIDAEPTLALAYWSMVNLSLHAHNYDETARWLTEIRQKLHIRLADLTKVPAYAGFVQWAAYQKWMAEQNPTAR